MVMQHQGIRCIKFIIPYSNVGITVFSVITKRKDMTVISVFAM